MVVHYKLDCKNCLSLKISVAFELKLSCDSRFQRAFTAYSCVFKVITLVWSNQRNFFENATTCSKRMRKTLVATQLKGTFRTFFTAWGLCNILHTKNHMKLFEKWQNILFDDCIFVIHHASSFPKHNLHALICN